MRAFVREYAEAVGLNGDELLDEHKDELPASQAAQQYEYVTPSRSSRASSGGSNPLFNYLPKVLVILLVVAILFAIYYAVINFMDPGESNPGNQVDDNEVITAPEEDEQGTSGEEESQQEENTTEQENQNEDENANEEPEEPSTEINVVSSDESKVETIYEVSNVDQIKLSLATTSDQNWLQVQGNSEYFQGMLTPDNSPLEFDIEENEVYLNIGSAQGLTITVNGKELQYEFDPNEDDNYIRQHIYIRLAEE